MKKLYSLSAVAILIALLLQACTKDRTFTSTSTHTQVVSVGTLLINEFAASGSTAINEFAVADDWFEIYNPSSSPVYLNAFKWHFSDDPATPTKWTLTKDTMIAPHGFLMVWCDKQDTVATQIHTSFGLSASGESVVISYTQDDGSITVTDSYTFGAQPSGKSTGRQTDGGSPWVVFDYPTPNMSNTGTVIPVKVDSASLVVNELVAQGSMQVSPTTGVGEDWFEIYNTSSQGITLEANKWAFVQGNNMTTYTLPSSVTIPANGHLVVWCDNSATVSGNVIHTNFNLSGSGDVITLQYTDATSMVHIIDTHTFGVQTAGHSTGRSPDGSTNWIDYASPTPGAANP